MRLTNKHILPALAALLLLSQTACGSQTQTEGTAAVTGDAAATETAAVTEDPGYDYAGKDFGGAELNILNFDSFYNAYVYLDFEGTSGEMLDDAVYNRNRRVEEALNFKLSEVKYQYNGWQDSQEALIDTVTKSVMAADYAYDAAYLPVAFKSSVITDGYLYDMYELPGMQLDQPWWDHYINDALELNGHLYAASSPMHLQTLDMSDVLLFNEKMFTNMGMDFPYQLVRDGKWTLDKFHEYIAALTQLNGDSSFTFTSTGNSVYGVAVHPDLIFAMTYSAGQRLAEKTDTGFRLTLEGERWYNVADKLANMLHRESGYALDNTDDETDSYYTKLFRLGRAAFVTAEIKMTMELRDMEDTFGLLPMPKYDEAQEDYYTVTGYSTALLTVPSVIENPEMVGWALDALSYDSWKSVLPIYYDVRLEQKGLRNNDSIAMLDIVRSSLAAEPTLMLGIAYNYVSAMDDAILNGNVIIASLAASHTKNLEKNIQLVADAFAD